MPTEDDEQTALVRYLRLRNIPHFRVPNETYTKSWKQRAKNKRLGVQPGIPDLFVLVAGRVLAIEMKRQKGSTTTPAQRNWLILLNKHGIDGRVCKGFLEAKAFIEELEAA